METGRVLWSGQELQVENAATLTLKNVLPDQLVLEQVA